MGLFFAYILKSLKDGKYNYGSAEDIERRVNRHNKGLVLSTRYRRPLELIYKEEFQTRSEAYRREMFFKSIDGYNWLKKERII